MITSPLSDRLLHASQSWLAPLLVSGCLVFPTWANSETRVPPEQWKLTKGCKKPAREEILQKAKKDLEARSPGAIVSEHIVHQGRHHWGVVFMLDPPMAGNHIFLRYDLCGGLREVDAGK